MKNLAAMWMAKQHEQQALQNHQQHQSVAFSYRCDACGKGYQHRATLLRHTRHECGKEPKFKCPYCPHRTKQRGNLYQHIRTNHPGKTVFSNTVDEDLKDLKYWGNWFLVSECVGLIYYGRFDYREINEFNLVTHSWYGYRKYGMNTRTVYFV